MGYHIVLVGIPGSGKTTLANILGQLTDFDIVLEEHRNKLFHADFARDMNSWAFHNQVEFLIAGANVHEFARRNPKTVCQDGCMYEYFWVFTHYLKDHGYLKDRDFQVIKSLFVLLEAICRPPDLCILLQVSLTTALERVNRRARNSDQSMSVDLSFMSEIESRLHIWFASWHKSQVLTVDTEAVDFANDLEAQREITNLIRTSLTNSEQ